MSRIVLDTQATVDDLLEIMRKRRSCRRYVSDPVPDDAVQKILEAGRWAPSGCSSEPWELIVVRDEGVRSRLADLYSELRKFSEELDTGPDGFPFPDMGYIKVAPVFVVVVGDRRLNRTYPQLFYRYDIYQQSMAACMENMFLAAAAQGLGATWISMGNKMEEPLTELFNVPSGYRIEFLLAVGWPDLQRQERDRRPLEEIVHYETFDVTRARSDEEIGSYIASLRARRRADREASGETPSSLGFSDANG
jgi:nitroreductase